jgi:hypothetical protein
MTKDTTHTIKSASYLDIYMDIDDEDPWRSELFNKRDYFNIPVVNFPFSSNFIRSS